MEIKGLIDSFNFSSNHLESYFTGGNYSIQTVKGVGISNKDLWIETFKKPLTRNIIEAKILHTSTGLEIPIKRFSVSQNKQTLEIAGLQGYNDKSMHLNELKEHIQDEVITRLDVAIDFKDKIPIRVIRELKKSRTPFKYANSTYLKTDGEKKTNYKINILIYPKHIKESLDDEMQRLEFSFKGAYFRGDLKVKDLSKAYEKMQKSIKRFTGLDVAIKAV